MQDTTKATYTNVLRILNERLKINIEIYVIDFKLASKKN